MSSVINQKSFRINFVQKHPEPMNKTCIQCKQNFIILPEDSAYYEKISVSEPKMCPFCRAQRRLAFRNERCFYKRPCDRCGKDGVSMYSPNKTYTVWCYDCWFKDDWDPTTYGRNYNPNRPFMDQWKELWNVVPKIALIHIRSVNSDYLNISADNKDCYMIIESSNNEGCTHCYWIQVCRDCVDVSFSHQTELSYESDDCYNCFKIFYSKGCHDCRESYFLLNCKDCRNCIGCTNLRNKQHCVFNRQCTKEEYEKERESMKLHSWNGVEETRERSEDFWKSQPKKYAEIINAPGSTGNYMKDTKNCVACFHCYEAEDCKYGVHVWRNAKDCMDVDTAGRNAERIYNSLNAGLDVSNYICSSLCWSSSFLEYCYYCFNSNHNFGCVGLRKKEYCILNREYDKAAYEGLRSKIISEMKKTGEYGEFFSPEASAFGYNETAAAEQFPLTKKEAGRKGFKWEDFPRGTYGKETTEWNNKLDSIRDAGSIDPSKIIFSCVSCKKNYRVIQRELDFYKNLEIPLPRLCPDCRHLRRFKARGPNRLHTGICSCEKENHSHGNSRCPNSFETSYAPGSKETIYCEECYQKEII